MKKLSNESWISCKKIGLPPLYIVSENNFRTTYRSEKVLVQTKRDEMFVAYCEKEKFADKRWDDEIKWVTHGTGGRRMKVVSKVIAWQELPKKYEGE